ncbi:MAG: hypothetical protein WC683_20725 [bacterium]
MGIEGTIAKWVLSFVIEAAKVGIEAIQAKDPAKMRKVRDFIGAPGAPLEAELVAAEEKAKRIAENERG